MRASPKRAYSSRIKASADVAGASSCPPTSSTCGEAPEWVQMVKDPMASSGTAARMPGDHDKYAVQCHITDELLKRMDGNWKCYAIVRCESGPQGGMIRRAIFDDSIKRSLVWIDQRVDKVWDNTYRTYYLGSRQLTNTQYFWVVPNGDDKATKAIYVDRLVVVRDR